MTQPAFLLCVSVLNALPGNVAIGSTKTECSVCIQECWKAPSSAQFEQQYPGIQVICEECLRDRQRGQPFQIPGPNREQMEEIRKLFGAETDKP